jgi:putative flippase GtrA
MLTKSVRQIVAMRGSNFVKQSLRFLAVGFVNTLIGLTLIYGAMFFFNADPAVANAIGYSLGLAVGFMLNRLWTFDDRRSMSQSLPRYIIMAAIAYFINLSAMSLSIYYFGIGPYVSQLVAIGAYTTSMFFGCKWFVFRAPHATSAKTTL